MVITSSIIKGGTGKTTTAAAIAQAAKALKRTALIIDLDPQANITRLFGASEGSGAYDLLHGANYNDVILGTSQGIDIIPGGPDLATEQIKSGSARRLSKAIEPLKKIYDYIIIDTPPAFSDMTYNGLAAADIILIPLEADNNSLQGLYYLSDTLEKISKAKAYIIITRYDNRPKLNRYFKEAIEKAGQETGADVIGVIRPGIAIKEAQALKLSIYDYAPESNPAKDYKEIFEKIEKVRKTKKRG